MSRMNSALAELTAALDGVMAADYGRLKTQLDRLRASANDGQPIDVDLARVREAWNASHARRAARLQALPQPAFPPELPINERRADIARAIREHQLIIVCGETGSGKTTQLPKICLDLQRGTTGQIACTQPRRIAARSVAARLSQELNSPLGDAVGYKIRFTDKTRPESYIKVMTDGILLAETQGDRDLAAYDTIIIDEAHERSLNIDFLLGLVRQLLPRRPDLKVIITSATIDAARFAQHFAHSSTAAPVIEVSGRLYPVEVRYRPIVADDEDEREADITSGIVDACDELARLGQGDILVFLPGEREIREAAEALRKHHLPGQGQGPAQHTEILPLFARLSGLEQDRVFKLGNGRRIVLATNVAETSLTVPGIRYVVDTGLARLNRYSVRNKVNLLQVEPISQAAAKQRAGRCGRLANGVAIRLYSEEDFAARPEFTTPEIQRTSLASVILRMQGGALGEVEDFPFIDPPSSRMIADGYQLLGELGAVDDTRKLTPIGKDLARLPVDPRIGRMLLAAREQQCVKEMLIIASALSTQDPRERPIDKQEAAVQAHSIFTDERSDFIGLLKLWEFFAEALAHKKSNRQLMQLCHGRFISHFRMREWRDVHHQLTALITETGFRLNEAPATYEQIHRALLAGLLGNVGFKDLEGEQYIGPREVHFVIGSGSALRKVKPKWVVAAELTETNRLYARCVGKVEPEWIESCAQHLLSRHYFDPHWEKSAAQVVAFERTTLYGLTLNPKRRVHYGAINPREAREIFIRTALVAREFDTRAPFFTHNCRLIGEVEALEHKARRQDVLVDDETLYLFYAELVGPGVVNGAGFEAWRKAAEAANPRLLYLTRDYLMRHSAQSVTEEQYPEHFAVGDIELPLRYRFEPGHALDGVTLTVPLHLLNQIDAAAIDWLVPGLRREKLTWHVKSLPKQIRRSLVPIAEFVTAALESMVPGAKPVALALAEFVQRQTGLTLDPAGRERESMPAHLAMNLRVVDDAGKELAVGRDLAQLRAQLGEAAQLTFGAAEPGIEREGLKVWDFGDLPAEIAFKRGNLKLTGYPALTDEGDSVAVRLFDARAAAEAAMRGGVKRLLRFELKEQIRQLEKSSAQFNQVALSLRGVMNAEQLREDWLNAVIDRAFIGEDALPRGEKEFQSQKQRARTRLPAVSEGLNRLAAEIGQEFAAVRERLVSAGPALSRLNREMQEQLRHLVYPGFLSATPWEQLAHLPRYLQAMRLRFDKYGNSPERDARNAASAERFWKWYQERSDQQRRANSVNAQLEAFRWLIEELRVSLFAQELKTPLPVSVKRLDKIWQSVV